MSVLEQPRAARLAPTPKKTPLQLYVSIAALGYFYLSNNHTLSVVFGRNLADRREVRARREHNVAVILGFLRKRSG